MLELAPINLHFNKDVRIILTDALVQYHLFDKNLPLVISFAPMDSGLSDQSLQDDTVQAFGFNFFKKQQFNVIAFAHKEDTYYRSDSFVSFIASIGNAISIFDNKIGYGISLGGFAVALHANSLGLERALLLMPQSSYSNKITPWEKKSTKACQLEDWNNKHNDAAICQVPLTIIYDPLCLTDKRHVDRFKCEVQHVRLFGVGHRIPRALRHLGILRNIVVNYINSGCVTHDFHQKIRDRRFLRYYLKNQLKNPTKKSSLKRRLVFLRLFVKLKLNKSFIAK
ncbi:hypothetical protein HQQ94_01420 [Shewanella sp. VB17]|uniref:hypothetical protein n=1 Tax=Shewanella sp. VB17 TaxID=2739432 RepID=UPI001567AE29|nr:hypothetical protein [Shewanella sp. VB17]NRD71926.1 hypothetical protein [Shewanella sp. VB17]